MVPGLLVVCITCDHGGEENAYLAQGRLYLMGAADELAEKTVHKVSLRLLPFLFLLYVVTFPAVFGIF
jgi:hypothetical protein